MLSNLNRRRFLRTAAGVLVPAPFVIGQSLRNPAFVARLTPASSTVSYTLEENFEGTGTPSGWSTVAGFDYDYTTTALQGAQSLHVTGANNSSQTITGATTVDIYFQCYFITCPSALVSLIRLQTAAATTLCLFRIISTQVGVHNGTAESFCVNAMAATTKYHVWMKYVSDGSTTVAFSTDGVRPTSGNNFVSIASATGTSGKLVVQGGSTQDVVVDRVLVLNSGTIGDNP